MADELLSGDRAIVLYRTEGTEGTDQIDADYDANTSVVYRQVYECEITENQSHVRQNNVRPFVAGFASARYENNGGVVLSGPLTGRSSTAGTAPAYSEAWLTIMKETTDPGVSVTYAIANTAQSSITVYRYDRHQNSTSYRLRRALGVRGNLLISLTEGEIPMWTLAEGQSTNYPDHLASRVYFDTDGDPAIDWEGNNLTYSGSGSNEEEEITVVGSAGNLVVSVGGTARACKDVQLDCAMTVVYNKQAGLTALVRAEGTAPNGTFTLTEGGADYDAMIALANIDGEPTQVALVFTLTLPSSKTITITLPKAQLGPINKTVEEGLAAFEIPFFACVDSTVTGEDDLTIAYT